MDSSFPVFISHFTGEKKLAEKLQDLLKAAFADQLQVFRSSDAESISTGEGQYSAILNALKSASVVIVLLSSESSHRPWVAFESGYAIGKKARLLPLLVRQAASRDVPSPFSEMQVRPVTANELKKLLDAVGEHTGLKQSYVDLENFLDEFQAAERELPNVRLELEPYLSDDRSNLLFRLWYVGHSPLTLQTIVAGIPWQTKDPNWPAMPVPGHLQIERKCVEGIDYVFKEYSVSSSSSGLASGGLGFKVLRPTLHPSNAPQDILWELRFALNQNSAVLTDSQFVRYWIETTDFKTPEQKIPMSNLKPL